MTPEPLVSVVIPVHNRVDCVHDAIESVLAQSYASLECVVVDDGSTDGTATQVGSRFGNDERVRLLTRANGGVSAARNTGVEAARGEYMTFLDSDDLMTPDRVFHQLASVRDGSFDAAMGRQEIRPSEVPLPGWVAQDPNSWDLHYHTSIFTSTALVRSLGGFDERLFVGEDIDFVVRLAATGARIAYLDETVVIRRYFGDNLSYGIVHRDGSAIFGAVRRVLAARQRAEP